MNPIAGRSLIIQTPEGVRFHIPLAGPYVRFLAYVIDLITIGVILLVLGTSLSLLNILSSDLSGALMFLFYFLITTGYTILLEWFWRGQTLGKWLFGLRVMDVGGVHLRFNQVLMRNLLRAVDGLPVFYLVGGFVCVFSRKNQRCGDFVANTVVARMAKAKPMEESLITSDKYNSFREYPHLEARLRKQTSPEEITLVVEAMLRRDDLDAAERLTLFADLTNHFRNKVGFPEEAVIGITDEQYLRNVLDSLYRGQQR